MDLVAFFDRRPRLSEKLTGTLVVFQGFLSIFTFVVLLFLLVDEDPWYTYTDNNNQPQQLDKEAVPITYRLIIATVAMSTLMLVLIVVPTRDTRVSHLWKNGGMDSKGRTLTSPHQKIMA